jgi:hypothetical protein
MRSNEQIKQQMFTHITQWQQSGLTQKSYCIQNNIGYHIFHYWYKCYRDNYSPAKQTSFIPLQVQPASTIPMVELLLSDGKRILFHQMVSSDYLKSLIN